mmetsp:Transcript_9371/g.22570  ORF Transcript_9371/g.22570 Transcript_9371/m.22570 type:complete len:267 (+) Transcript_9371:44-844(+)
MWSRTSSWTRPWRPARPASPTTRSTLGLCLWGRPRRSASLSQTCRARTCRCGQSCSTRLAASASSAPCAASRPVASAVCSSTSNRSWLRNTGSCGRCAQDGAACELFSEERVSAPPSGWNRRTPRRKRSTWATFSRERSRSALSRSTTRLRLIFPTASFSLGEWRSQTSDRCRRSTRGLLRVLSQSESPTKWPWCLPRTTSSRTISRSSKSRSRISKRCVQSDSRDDAGRRGCTFRVVSGIASRKTSRSSGVSLGRGPQQTNCRGR